MMSELMSVLFVAGALCILGLAALGLAYLVCLIVDGIRAIEPRHRRVVEDEPKPVTLRCKLSRHDQELVDSLILELEEEWYARQEGQRWES